MRNSRAPLSLKAVYGPILLILSIVMLLLIPIRTVPANVAANCGRLITEPTGRALPTVQDHRPWFASVLQEQRLEAVCEDAAAARWWYVLISALAFLLAVGRVAGRWSTRALLAIIWFLGLLILLAAIFDGPPLPLGVAVVGCIVAGYGRPPPSDQPGT